jgi:hypothetical protein
MNAVYGLPFNLTRRWEARVGGPLHARTARALAPASGALDGVWRACVAVFTCGGHCGPQPEPAAVKAHADADVSVHSKPEVAPAIASV